MYKALRITEETMGKIADVQLAFESAYMRRMTRDELVQKLIDCIEDAEPAVWENYCLIQEQAQRLRRLPGTEVLHYKGTSLYKMKQSFLGKK